ncbi:hypothetical protein GP486_006948 [Trichoglossum hirsutum]|uniref:BZIP domain-containing protein n=1 Tax=Trichoglossum hirsutum TaxID=265104 RepID=A0A9P8L747_9PEZI|nr:hypothetical protein GP486_006948 [Trichoglossum hirsutum]
MSTSPLDSEHASAGEGSRGRSGLGLPVDTENLRTHRERKEQYIKALEQEVMRLREVFSNVTRDKETYAEENRKLKELLRLHGISWASNTFGGGDPNQYIASDFPGSVSDRSASYGMVSQGVSPPSVPVSTYTPAASTTGQRPAMDYDSIGIDFVLTYDRTPYLSPPPQ